MQKLKQLSKTALPVIAGAIVGIAILGIYVFGAAILEQAHHTFIREHAQSVVKITNLPGNSGGTGFFVRGKSGKVYVMTNGHVCHLGKKEGEVIVDWYGMRSLERIVRDYEMNDLCAVEAPSGAEPLKLAKSIEDGDIIHSVGHPLLESMTVTDGEQSGKQTITIMVGVNVKAQDCQGPTYHIENAPPMAQFFGIDTGCFRTLKANASTLNILPGNSGSPALNNWGNVIGVVFASAGESGGVRSYIVPLSDLAEFLMQL